MYLNSLSLINFKNIDEAKFNFSSRVNCFLGNNGQGKTNVLDAIHHLSYTKSYFNSIDSQNIKFDTPFYVIQGEVSQEDDVFSLFWHDWEIQRVRGTHNHPPPGMPAHSATADSLALRHRGLATRSRREDQRRNIT